MESQSVIYMKMKSHRFYSALKHAVCCLAVCLVFCSMSRCESERALDEGNDLDFTLSGLPAFPEGLFLYSSNMSSVEFDGKRLDCEAPLLSDECLQIPDFKSLSVTVSSESGLAAGKVYAASQEGTSLDIVLEYVAGESGEVLTATAENASLKVSLISSRYVTGIFSCDFRLLLPDENTGDVTEYECHARNGYFNIFLL